MKKLILELISNANALKYVESLNQRSPQTEDANIALPPASY